MRFGRTIVPFISTVFSLTVAGISASSQPVHAATIQGVMTRLVGDAHPALGGGTQTLYVLTGDDGTRKQLDFSRTSVSAGKLRAMLRQRVEIDVEGPVDDNGERAAADSDTRDDIRAPRASRVSDTGVSSLRVSDIRVIGGALKRADVTGNRPFVSVLCKFSDIAIEPRPPSYFQTELGPTFPGFNHYFREASYNTLTLDGSASAPAWVTMPQPRSYYMALKNDPNQYLFLGRLADHCTQAADSIVDFSLYYGINLMFNAPLDGGAWAGDQTMLLDDVFSSMPATWMPYYGEPDQNGPNDFGWRAHNVLAHEMSHAFGASHSAAPDGNEYGSEWDVVSGSGGICAIVDANYGCIAQSMSAWAKETMGILPANRQATHAGGTRTYTIERLAQPPSADSIVMLRVPIAGTVKRFYVIESRHRIGYDVQLPASGVIIHEVDTDRDASARLVAQGGNGPNLGGAPAVWPVGATFTSNADNVSIRIESFSAANGTATVRVGAAGLPGVTVPLTVTRSGSGAGNVTSVPAGIACGATCTFGFDSGTQVTLTATPEGASTFTGWLGKCTGRLACVVTVSAASSVSATFAPNTVLARVDVDGNGAYGALTDGLLALRYLFGLSGAALTNRAIATGAPRSTPAAVTQFLENIKPLLDVDGNGQADATTDGVMLLRYMFSLRGSSLVGGAVGAGAIRTTAPQIEPYLSTIMP
jgi:M6 family metalloprotease-like protein